MAHNVVRGEYMPDEDGFGIPQVGGEVNVKYGTVAFGDTGGKTIFTLPAGAIPVLWYVNVTTAFNSSGTDLLDLGYTGSLNAFLNDLDVSSVGQKYTGFTPAALFAALDSEAAVIATYAQSVADAAAGAATVACFYIIL